VYAGFVLGVMLLATTVAPTYAQDKRPALDAAFETGQLDEVTWSAERDVPVFLSGELRAADGKRGVDAARAFLAERAPLFGVDESEEAFRVTQASDDGFGRTHVRIHQEVGGVPVFGAESIVHLNQRGAVYAFNGDVYPEAARVDTRPSLAAGTAIEAAKADLPAGTVYRWENVAAPEDFGAADLPDWRPTAELVVYPIGKDFVLAYHVTLAVDAPRPANWEVLVDAHTGAIVDRYNSIHTMHDAEAHAESTVSPVVLQDGIGSGTSTFGGTLSIPTYLSGGNYYLYNTTRGPSYIRTMTANNGTSLPGSYVTDADNNFTSSSQRAAVDAHYGAVTTFDYYKNTHNRSSYDNNNATITSTVHYSSNYNNAFWNGSQMVYGDGDGSTFIALVSLDIAAHELTHAVTERTAGLIYQNESGALNESVSDIFAVMVDRDDWLVGEDSYTPGTSGDALRYMNNPPLGDQPDRYADRYTGTGDNGGVHINSGIPNKVAYLMAAGGTHYGQAVTSIGRAKTEAIWYRALTSYFTQSTNFAAARSGVLQATADLYGTSGTEYATVQNAWASVGIGSPAGGGGGGGGGSNDTYEPNDSFGQAHGPLASGTTYSSFIASSSDDDYYTFTSTASGTITVSLANFPGDYDVFLYNSSQSELGRGYTANDPETISVSNAAAGTYYVRVDGYNGASSTTDDYELTVTFPTGGGGGGTPQWYYEDLVFESPHNYPNNYNDSKTYTKAGAQRVAMYFSQFNTEANYDFVYIKDQNGTTQATYHGSRSAFWAIVDGASITANLVTDYSVRRYGYKVTRVAYYSPNPLFAGGDEGTPLAVAPEAAASMPVEIGAKALAGPVEFALGQNAPNPMRGAATISYALPETAAVRLVVYDVLGREVAVLADARQEAGTYEVSVDAARLPAGTYFYRIEAGDRVETKQMTVVR
jgi:Zn-dependent metalloprotease